jgi:hypothetical protein
MIHESEHECECGWIYECWTYPCHAPFQCQSCRTIDRKEEEMLEMEEKD